MTQQQCRLQRENTKYAVSLDIIFASIFSTGARSSHYYYNILYCWNDREDILLYTARTSPSAQQWHLPGIYNYRKAGQAAVIINKIRKTYRKYVLLYKKLTTKTVIIIIIKLQRCTQKYTT